MATTRKSPPKKAPGKKAAKTGLSNEWASKAIAGIRRKQREAIVKGK